MNRSGLKVSVEDGRAVVKCSNEDCHCVSNLAGLVAVVPSEHRASVVAQVSVNDDDTTMIHLLCLARLFLSFGSFRKTKRLIFIVNCRLC